MDIEVARRASLVPGPPKSFLGSKWAHWPPASQNDGAVVLHQMDFTLFKLCIVELP